ncbi:helix-turn-helix domain-containing protein [Nocardia sp. NBC_01327]|uniref:helix-turn-helix domain-containing protein n=1 Tax=Nocardia sp. NBC_01327 TaxID=2903593 RepID=UPI002E0D20C1|nr:XRE family transcriptional regulator [Nocardia sp. NBC_01327]
MSAFLRSHRRRAGLSLDALAERTGLTKSYISKIERGLSTPSIAVALRIAHVLDADVSQLFSENPDRSALLAIGRSSERAEPAPSGPANYQPLATQIVGKAMQPFVVTPSTEPGASHVDHHGDEFVFVHKGAVEVSIPGNVITLNEGDSLYFDADTPHQLRSISAQRAEVLIVVHDRDAADVPAAPRSRA